MLESNLAAYVIAASLIMAAPGPANMLVMTRGASSLRAGVLAVVGLLASNVVLLAAAILGLSSLVLASAAAFLALKWIGALYLFILGVRLILKAGACSKSVRPMEQSVLSGFLTGVTNPKALIFYFAFLPQFVTDRSAAPLQLIGLGLADLALAAAIFGAYAAAGSGLMRLLKRSQIRVWLDRCVGGVMIGSAGLVLKTARIQD